MKTRLFAATGMLAILLSLLLVGCGMNEHDKNTSPGESSQKTNAAAPKTLDELRRADIGVMTGTNFPDHVKEAMPEANTLFYNTVADEVTHSKAARSQPSRSTSLSREIS